MIAVLNFGIYPQSRYLILPLCNQLSRHNKGDRDIIDGLSAPGSVFWRKCRPRRPQRHTDSKCNIMHNPKTGLVDTMRRVSATEVEVGHESPTSCIVA